jgi:tight adherence protein B
MPLPFLGKNSFLFLAVLVFIAVMLGLEGLYGFWRSYRGPESKRIRERLRSVSAHQNTEDAKLLKQRMLSTVPSLERLLLKFPASAALQQVIDQAGLQWTVSGLLLSCIASGTIGMFIVSSIAHQGLLWSAGAGMALAIVPWLYVQRKRWIRLRKIERQLPEALDLLTRALRSGHAFSSALQMLGEEMAEPIAGEFRIVRDEVNFGVALSQALMNLCERVPVTDLRYFVVSVLIQRDSGGNLTEVLSNLSRLIRERMKLFGKIRVLSSEGRLSAWILGLMPLGMVALLEFANPEFIEPLWTDPIGIAIVKTLVVLMAIGVLVLIKIIRIRV